MMKIQVELKAAMDFQKPMIMCCGSAERNLQTGNYKFVDDLESLYRLQWMVDVEQAQAKYLEDQKRILGEIKDTCGAQVLNKSLSKLISQSVTVAVGRKKYPEKGRAIQAAVCGEPDQLAEIPDEEIADVMHDVLRTAQSMNAYMICCVF